MIVDKSQSGIGAMVWRTSQLTGIESGPHIVDISLIAASRRKDGVFVDDAMHIRNSGRSTHDVK